MNGWMDDKNYRTTVLSARVEWLEEPKDFSPCPPQLLNKMGWLGLEIQPQAPEAFCSTLSTPASPLPSLALSRLPAAANHTLVKHA